MVCQKSGPFLNQHLLSSIRFVEKAMGILQIFPMILATFDEKKKSYYDCRNICHSYDLKKLAHIKTWCKVASALIREEHFSGGKMVKTSGYQTQYGGRHFLGMHHTFDMHFLKAEDMWITIVRLKRYVVRGVYTKVQQSYFGLAFK